MDVRYRVMFLNEVPRLYPVWVLVEWSETFQSHMMLECGSNPRQMAELATAKNQSYWNAWGYGGF